MTERTSNIRWFDQISAGDVNSVGGKGANLGEMTAAGLPVPPGFCITADAYRDFIQNSGVGATIQRILAQTRMERASDVDEQSERIRELIERQAMPDTLAAQIRAGYEQLASALGAASGSAIPVAVRSSATAEDLPTASFAGQQDTYLNVRGVADLLAHVRRCWASLWTARAVSYRVKQGFAHEQVALAVVVQAMIESEVSGILFTANPVSGNRDEVVINASWGLGEAIVSGLVTPDTLTVRKSDGALLSQQLASKNLSIEFAPDGSGTLELEVPAERRELPALSDEQVAQLVALSQRIEAHYGAPMDIEWAYARGRFYILQARAITTLAQPAQQVAMRGNYNRTMFVEIFPDPLSPIFLSVVHELFQSMLDFTFKTLGFSPPKDMPAIGAFYSQPYFNRGYIEAALQPLSPPVRAQLVTQIINPFGRHARGAPAELSPAFMGMALRLLRFMLRFPSQLPGLIAQYRAEIREVESLPLATLSDRAIVDRLLRLAFGSGSALLNYDFLMIALIGITYQTLGALLERYFGGESEEIRSKLISGVTGNVTMETNKHLWDLAQLAKASPGVAAVVRQYAGPDIRERLERTPEGPAFLDALDRFLGEYGHREVRMDILYPTWSEDPSPVLAFVRGYLDVSDAQSPHRQQERLVKQRAELMQTVQARVRRDARGRWLVFPIFRWVLKHTQAHTRERDTMHFELTRLFPPFRRILLELGERWSQQHWLATPDDIFFLSLAELQQMADAPQAMQAVVQQRRAEFESNKTRSAPGIIQDGVAVLPAASEAAESVAGQFRGIAGSPGTASGVARVIYGPEDFNKLQSGEILVAPLTNPVWTPLFAIAGGIVTEVGGILSHGAIVAREYGIPAVMGVAGATKVLSDGQQVLVDGSRGVVSVQQGAAS